MSSQSALWIPSRKVQELFFCVEVTCSAPSKIVLSGHYSFLLWSQDLNLGPMQTDLRCEGEWEWYVGPGDLSRKTPPPQPHQPCGWDAGMGFNRCTPDVSLLVELNLWFAPLYRDLKGGGGGHVHGGQREETEGKTCLSQWTACSDGSGGWIREKKWVFPVEPRSSSGEVDLGPCILPVCISNSQ